MPKPAPRQRPLLLKLRDPSYEDDEGRLYPGDLEQIIESTWNTSPFECDHETGACIHCLNDWVHEFTGVIVFEGDGPDIDIEALHHAFNRLI